MAKKLNIKEIARRYTTAVFELARAEGKLDEVGNELEKLAALLADNKSLGELIKSPLLKKAEQLAIIRELAGSQKFGKLTSNLLLIVAQNGRSKYLPEIIASFLDKIAKEKDEMKVQVISAEKLEEDQLDKITAGLTKKNGKTVRLEQLVNPEILGGLIVKVGSQMYDYSIKSRLNKLKTKLQAAS